MSVSKQIDECPVRGCGFWIPGTDPADHDGQGYYCSGPRRHALTLVVFKGGHWGYRNDGPTKPKAAK